MLVPVRRPGALVRTAGLLHPMTFLLTHRCTRCSWPRCCCRRPRSAGVFAGWVLWVALFNPVDRDSEAGFVAGWALGGAVLFDPMVAFRPVPLLGLLVLVPGAVLTVWLGIRFTRSCSSSERTSATRAGLGLAATDEPGLQRVAGRGVPAGA